MEFGILLEIRVIRSIKVILRIMANTIQYNDKSFHIGDTVTVAYKIKDGDKERIQNFKGTLIKVRGDAPEQKMITVRRISNIGLGIERIFPLFSPHISNISLDKKTGYFKKAKLYFIRNLTGAELRRKLYRQK